MVADRLARILSVLTWPIVAPTGHAEQARFRIQVPAIRYHVVTRALNKAWRQAHAQIRDTANPSGADTLAAVALWRMALLISGPGPRTGALNVRVAAPTAAEMLTSAGAILGILTSTNSEGRGVPTLVVCRRPDVVHLLTVTGTGPASARWAAGR